MLNGLLPAPKHSYGPSVASQQLEQQEATAASLPSSENSGATRPRAPPYLHRKGYLPRDVTDFDDGGAFPELHVLQYPLNIGKPGQRSAALVPVVMDDKGALRTDMIVRQGSNKNKLIQSGMSDLTDANAEEGKVALPQEDEAAATAEKTRLALESLINSKIKSSKPSKVPQATEEAEPSYIRYTPNPAAPGFNAAAKQRVIKMVEAQVDPMEPPKHKITNVPRGPPSPPVPVLHSPPRKLTVEDQQAWKVPPCVSNWKNARGFIIPLDKRVAADGRGLQEVTINNKFATVSEALYIAERKATEDLKLRNEIRKKMALKEKEDREEQLRMMANAARMERAGAMAATQRQEEREEGGDVVGHDDEGEYRRRREVAGESGFEEWSRRGSTAPRAAGPPGAPRGVSNLPAWMTDKNSEHHLGNSADQEVQDRGSERREGSREISRDVDRDERRRDYDSSSRSWEDGDAYQGDHSRDANRRRDSRDESDRDRRYRDADRRCDSRDADDRDRRYRATDRRRDSHSPERDRHRGATLRTDSDSDHSSDDGFQGETEEEKIKREQRERMRLERRKERERELRIENMKGNMRKNKVDRDEGRDISEKIALGVLKGSGKLTGESLYDSRLFNQSGGMDSGFGGEDDSNAYTKPLFDRGDAASSIYRPKADSDAYGDADSEFKKLSDTSRFKPDKGFVGAEGSASAGPRSAPVQFEKSITRDDSFSSSAAAGVAEADPFGIADLVGREEGSSRDAKRQRRD